MFLKGFDIYIYNYFYCNQIIWNQKRTTKMPFVNIKKQQ